MDYKYSAGAKRNKPQKSIVFLIGISMLLGGVIAAAKLLPHSQHHEFSQVISTYDPPAVKKVIINYGLPIRLQIPKIQINTHVINVGLTKDGNMSIPPTNVIDVGWYKYGALPGNTGTALMAGHLDGIHGELGVFGNINKLVPGDTILVTDSNGLAISFVVREKKVYPKTEQPAEVFNSTSGSHLNLVTCTGTWDSAEHQFTERLVVFADKAS